MKLLSRIPDPLSQLGSRRDGIAPVPGRDHHGGAGIRRIHPGLPDKDGRVEDAATPLQLIGPLHDHGHRSHRRHRRVSADQHRDPRNDGPEIEPPVHCLDQQLGGTNLRCFDVRVGRGAVPADDVGETLDPPVVVGVEIQGDGHRNGSSDLPSNLSQESHLAASDLLHLHGSMKVEPDPIRMLRQGGEKPVHDLIKAIARYFAGR
jgi:hypothetical protein